jgi:hypothetical protein
MLLNLQIVINDSATHRCQSTRTIRGINRDPNTTTITPTSRMRRRSHSQYISGSHIIKRASSLTRTMTDIRANAIPVFNGQPAVQPLPIDLFLRLDSYVRPGLTEKQLCSLITRCDCGMIMTRRVFEMHRCLPQQVIDLTNDD